MASGTELSTGMVVDVETGQAYVMAPGGGVNAIALEDGSTVWHSDAADKPLLLIEDLLLSQARISRPDAVPIRMLSVRDGGAVASEGVVPLPRGVDPVLSPTADRSFTVSAVPLDGDAMVRWQFRQRPLRGMADGPDEVLPDESFENAAPPTAPVPGTLGAATSTTESVVRGQVRLSLTDGAVQPMVEPFAERGPMSVPQFAGRPLDTAPDVPSLAPDGSERFKSSDGRHEMASTPLEIGDALERYRWEIFPAGGADPIGRVVLHVGFAPFLVADGHLLVELQPYARMTGGALTDEPMQLRAYDLLTGEMAWSSPTRDIYAVPPPPP